MMKNPVMFVVEVGSVVTTALLIEEAVHGKPVGFDVQITLWLWFTVLFANFAEAVAEGRGKAQADTLRKAKGETMAYRLRPDGSMEAVSSSQLRLGDVIRVEAGQFIAGDGEVIEGVASVDESAITGESAPVIREAGGDRSRGDGGDAGAFRLDQDSDYVESRRDVSGPHDCAGGRSGAAEDAERDCAEHSAGGADGDLSAGGGDAAAVCDLFARAADDLCAGVAAGVPDSDDDWRLCFRRSGLRAWIGWCSTTCWPCPGGRWKRRAT